jgi:transposase-like protein
MPLFLRSRAMAEQVTKLTPVCAACSKQMTFVDAIGSPEGPIVIFRCPDCKKLFWEKPRRDEK